MPAAGRVQSEAKKSAAYLGKPAGALASTAVCAAAPARRPPAAYCQPTSCMVLPCHDLWGEPIAACWPCRKGALGQAAVPAGVTPPACFPGQT